MTKIMVVDDDESTRKALKIILENEGFEVLSLDNGEDALTELKKDNVDLVLVDILMPLMGGWEFFEEFKKFNKKTKVIMITAVFKISEKKIEELKKEGVGDYIMKPFNNKEIIEKIKNVLGK